MVATENSYGLRLELFRISMKNIEMSESINLEILAEKTRGYSGADIANVCRDAAMMVSNAALSLLRLPCT